jgi:mono/diheme cytochrome c family protein
LALTHRGELETLLAVQGESGDDVTDEGTDELVEAILGQWQAATGQVVEPATTMPAFTPESVEAGAAVFQKRECFKCHGRDGRGGLAGGIEVGKDVWGNIDPAADLTSGMLHGGGRPIDIYRRIYAGINGSPMPAFKDALAAEPDTVWQLTHYVMHLSDQRRRGVKFSPDGAKANAAEGATAPASATEPADGPASTESK